METQLSKAVAQSFHSTTGIDFDDLFQEACCAYLEAEQDPNFDPARGRKLTSYAYWRMQMRLINYCRQHQAKVGPLITNVYTGFSGVDRAWGPPADGNFLNDETDRSEAKYLFYHPSGMDAFEDYACVQPDHSAEVQQFIDCLDPACKEVCRHIFQDREGYSLLGWQGARHRLRDELKAAGWGREAIASTFRRMRQLVTDNLGGHPAVGKMQSWM